jgi:hypothetical protein
MKKILLAVTLFAGFATTSSLNAQANCRWDTQPAWGWDGPGIYAGIACYSAYGDMISFSPRIPWFTLG